MNDEENLNVVVEETPLCDTCGCECTCVCSDCCVEKLIEVEKIVEVEKVVEIEKIVEVQVGMGLSREEMKGLLSNLPTHSDRTGVQSAKEKLEAALKQ